MAHNISSFFGSVQMEMRTIIRRLPTASQRRPVLNSCCAAATRCLRHLAEVLSRWSERRDRVHKRGDYADAGIPHYRIVSFDKIGARTIERYALSGRQGGYTHIGATHRDRGPVAVSASDPFALEILWQDLEIAAR